MWKSKRFVIIAVIVAVLLIGGIAGVAIAKTASDSTTSTAMAQTTSDNATRSLISRVATILGLPQSTVQSAFDKAQKDMADEALHNRLNSLVQQGKMTQDQANQYEKWYQSRPDVPLPGMGPMGRFGGPGSGFRMPKGIMPPTTAPVP